MHGTLIRSLVLFCAIAAAPAIAADAAAHRAEVEAARKERLNVLQKPDGWLTLIGLHFLKEGPNTVGSAKDNAVVLGKGPAHAGTVTVAPDGKVTISVARDADLKIDGERRQNAELKWSEPAKPTLVTAGSVTFFAVDRGGKKALRVKDSESTRRTHFLGLDYFPIDPRWRIEARWEAFEKSRLMPITTMIGQTAPEPIPGKAVFTLEGKTYELLPIDEGRDVPLFFVISDLTSGKETYGGCRFLYVPWPKEGADKIVLDFNLAENPPCAFTPYSTCPLPPKENRLPFSLPVGEKSYRGGHD